MTYRLLLLHVVSITLLAISSASAQGFRLDDLTVGIGGGYEYWSSYQAPVNDTCLCNPSHQGTLHQTHAFIELAAPTLFSQGIGLSARVEWVASSASLTYAWPGILVLIPEHPVNHHDERRVTFSMRSVGLDLLGMLHLPCGFSLGLGPSVGYRSVRDYRDTLQIDSLTKSYSPYPGWTKEYSGDNAAVEENHLALGALLITSYQLSLCDHFSLVPELRLRADFTPPMHNDEWKTFSYGGALAIRYSFGSDQPAPADPSE